MQYSETEISRLQFLASELDGEILPKKVKLVLKSLYIHYGLYRKDQLDFFRKGCNQRHSKFDELKYPPCFSSYRIHDWPDLPELSINVAVPSYPFTSLLWLLVGFFYQFVFQQFCTSWWNLSQMFNFSFCTLESAGDSQILQKRCPKSQERCASLYPSKRKLNVVGWWKTVSIRLLKFRTFIAFWSLLRNAISTAKSRESSSPFIFSPIYRFDSLHQGLNHQISTCVEAIIEKILFVGSMHWHLRTKLPTSAI